jgi:hypothetical protein
MQNEVVLPKGCEMTDTGQPDMRTPQVFRFEGKDYVSMDEYLRLNKRYRDFYSPRWISVGERLPEVHVTVLAVTRAFPQDIRLAQMASFDGVMWRFCDMDDDDVDSFGITHWMPLPAPPKADK